MTVDCKHWNRERDCGRGTCALGWFGGKPYIGNCVKCLAKGNNTEQAKDNFDGKMAKAFPEHIEKITGCC